MWITVARECWIKWQSISKSEWYDSAADIETKRKLVRTAIEIQRYAGTVKAVREQVETIYKKTRIEEWFS